MKKLITTSILAALVAAVPILMAQNYPDEYLGLPGDNLNLYAVMKLFQESETLEGFERSLNDENSRINNLDLNGDNLIDYINVVDYPDGNVHTIVLRTALSKYETQDIAVFTVQKLNNGSVEIQLVGDDDLYGKGYIIEPNYNDAYAETPNPGYTGRSRNNINITIVRTTPFEIAAWPIIRFIYMPGYVVWRSSWYWGYYPVYWHPWRPFFWHYYYGYHYRWHPHYYAHFRLCHQHRYVRYNDFYYSGIRAHSPMVASNVKSGYYKTTYSHPETRREGEALYSRTIARETSRRSESSASNGNRTAGVSGSRNERSAGTISGSSPRSATTVNSRTSTKSSGDQKSAVSRRSAPSVSSRQASRPEQHRSSASSGSRTSRESVKKSTSSKSERSKSSEDSQRRK